MTDGRVRERQEDFEEAQRRALQDLKAESRKGSTRHSPAGHLYGTDELSRTGVHEAGHALAAWSTCYAASLFAITVGENGGKTGIIWRSTSNATGLYWEWMVSCLGGIAAEMTVYGRFRSGESRSDLILARAYAEKIWETEIRDGSREEAPWLKESAAMRFDVSRTYAAQPSDRVREILNESYMRVRSVVRVHESKLSILARAATSKKQLAREEIEFILGPRPWTMFLTR